MDDKSSRQSLGENGKQRRGKIPRRKSRRADAGNGKASDFGQKEKPAVPMYSTSDGGAKHQGRNRIPRLVRATCKKSASFDVSSLAEVQPSRHSHDDVTWFTTSSVTENRQVPGVQRADHSTSSVTSPAEAGQCRLKRTSSIPTLTEFSGRSVLRSEARAKRLPTTTATPPNSAPLHRLAGLQKSGVGPGGGSSGREGVKTKHRQSSREGELRVADIPPFVRLGKLGDTRGDLAGEEIGDQSKHRPLQVTAQRYGSGEAAADHRRGEKRNSSSNVGTIRGKRVTGLEHTRTCDIADEDRGSDAQIETGNELTTRFARDGYNISATRQTGACAHRDNTKIAGSFRGEISEEQRSGLPESQTGLASQSVPDSVPAFDKRDDSDYGPPEHHSEARVAGGRHVAIGGGIKRTNIGGVKVGDIIGPAAHGGAVTCSVPAVCNQPRAQLGAATRLKGRGGATPPSCSEDTPGDSLQHTLPYSKIEPASEEDSSSCSAGVAAKEFPQECDVPRPHSSSRIVTPLETAPLSPVRKASPRPSPESKTGADDSLPVPKTARISAGATASHFNGSGSNGLPNRVEDSEIEHRATVRGHDTDTATQRSLSTHPDVGDPRNTADQNTAAETLLAHASAASIDSLSQTRCLASAAATPAGESNQNSAGEKRSGSKAGNGSGADRQRKLPQGLSKSSNPLPPKRRESKVRKDTASSSGDAEESRQESNSDRLGNVQSGSKRADLHQQSSSVNQLDQEPARTGRSESEAEKGGADLGDAAGRREIPSHHSADQTLTSELSPLESGVSERGRGRDVRVQCCDSHTASVQNYDTGDTLSRRSETKPHSVVGTDRRFAALTGSQHITSTDSGGHSDQVGDNKTNEISDSPATFVESELSERDSNSNQTDSLSRDKDLKLVCTVSTVTSKDSNSDCTTKSSSGYKDSNTDAANIRRSVSRKPVGKSAQTFITRRKKSYPTQKERLVDTSSVSASVISSTKISSTNSKPSRRKSLSGVFKEGTGCVSDKEVCEKGFVFGVPDKGLNVDRWGPGAAVDDKPLSGNDSATIYLTRIKDTNRQRGEKGGSSVYSRARGGNRPVSGVDKKLQSKTKDSNRDPLDTTGTLVTAAHPKGHDTATAAVFKEHSREGRHDFYLHQTHVCSTIFT